MALPRDEPLAAESIKRNFRTLYRAALAAWLCGAEAADPIDATALRAAALGEGCGFLDLLAMHQALVWTFVTALGSSREIARRLARADEFLLHVAGACGTAPDGASPSVVRLRRRNATLERELAERTTALAASEQRFHDIVEASADWIWETDLEHRYTAMGPSPLHGGPPGALIGKTRWEAAGGDIERDERWRLHKADLDAHRPFRDFRYSSTYPLGQLIHIRVSGQPVFDPAGAFKGYRGTTTNETAMIETAQRAQRAETMLRDAIDSIPGGFLICDTDDRIVHSNPQIRWLYADCAETLEPGVPYEAFIRASVERGYYPGAAGREEEFVAECMAAHRGSSNPVQQRMRGGRWGLVHERRMSGGGTVTIGVEITPLKEAQAALATSEERLDRAQALARIGSWEEDLTTGAIVWSKEMHRIRGVAPGAAPSVPAAVARGIASEDAPRIQEWFRDLKRGIAREPIECNIEPPGSEKRVVRYEGYAILDDNGQVAKIAGTLQDVTRRTELQRQLIQAQKMEAIGGLTGGMAHDFNNLLGVIIGNLDLLRDLAKGNAEIDELAADALDAALRGADLSRRLLAFARRQPLRPEKIDINHLVTETVHLLRRTLGEDIVFELDLAPALSSVTVDAAQLEAAITNLATNARDAMPRGGGITIATANRRLDEDYAKSHLDVTPGDYVAIEFSDTGTGMTPDVASRIFEPFYTTKEQGKGTGLGLAMVFGFMRQSGGHVSAYSEPGIGTVFRLYLPADRGTAAEGRTEHAARGVSSRGECVLVVEDNEKLRAVVMKQLDALGYAVLAAADARAALDILERQDPVDLLLTDIVMPGAMNGIELAGAAENLRPGLKVLLTSGFPQARLGEATQFFPGRSFLGKPYRRDELARALRAALDDPHGRAAPAGKG